MSKVAGNPKDGQDRATPVTGSAPQRLPSSTSVSGWEPDAIIYHMDNKHHVGTQPAVI
jgi:hypothetical protein